MTRKKRVSLKDKGPDILGMAPKKGQGIDVLFGGPVDETVTGTLITDLTATGLDTSVETEPEEISLETDMAAVFAESAQTGAPGIATAPPLAPPVFASLETDELGLPVAMDAPPTDLELAVPALESPVLSDHTTGEVTDMFDADDDLSGLLEENYTEAETVSASTVASTPAVETGLPGESQADIPPVADIPAVDYSFEPASPPAAATPPPIYPSPVPVPVSPVSTPPAPSSLAPARPIIESLGGIITEKVAVTAADLLPSDVRDRETISNVLDLQQRSQLEKDDAISARVSRYVGRDRRENLDKEIERLYQQVAEELSTNKEDAEFALRTLSEAQDIVLEDTRQYDEALYRVAVVKTMLARKKNLRQWSYTWGVGVFFYAVLWLAAFITGLLMTDALGAAMGDTGQGLTTVKGAWFSALAGGIGGIIGIFYSLYWHVAMKQDFDRQYVMYYLVQPIMGFVLGALIYFIVLAGYLFFNFSTPTESPGTVTAIGLVLGFVAGFRQRVVFEMIDRIVKKLLPKDTTEPDQKPVSLIPTDYGES